MLKKFFSRLTFSSIKLFFLVAAFWMEFANGSFFLALFQDYPLTQANAPFIATLVFGFTSVTVILLCLMCFRTTCKPILITLLIGSSFAAYFMDAYHVLLDDSMIRNMVETDTKEVGDLLSVRMVGYVLLLGVLPSLFIYRVRITYRPFVQELLLRLKWIVSLLAVTVILLFMQNASTASFFREHKAIRAYSNPLNYIYAIGKYLGHKLPSTHGQQPLILLGKDAKIPDSDHRRDLVIMVVGETARADRFSLNGYKRLTNPLLAKQGVVSFRHVQSCATSTAISVPCMFSLAGAAHFDVDEASNRENVLDVMKRSGAHVLWRDNNSSSKGVADRVSYQDYWSRKINPVCDTECRDEGMLVGLQDYIDSKPTGDIVIVLHQMGNHGPAYYKRYTKPFEKFTPTCQTIDLANCSREEIDNAYDNAILYTDYFLNNVIELLKKYDGKFDVSMLYASDHGESLGEDNLYLHGLPNLIAPETQRHVPMVMWLGKHFHGASMDVLEAKRDKPLSHDNIAHTLLGLLEVESYVYDKDLDLIQNNAE